jgi:hypothetical protein
VDGRTDLTVRSETYDRDLTDIFTIQSEVAQVVPRKLTATISPVEKKRMKQSRLRISKPTIGTCEQSN